MLKITARAAGAAVAALGLFAAGGATVGQWQGSNPFDEEARRCTFFEHAEFEGEFRDVRDGESVPWVGDKWNDRISSIRCHRRCTATVYEHINRAGQSATFGGRTAFLGDWWDERISGVEVSCASDGERGARRATRTPRASCTFYADAGHRGESVTLSEGVDGSWVGNRWNDRISSFTCRPGCAAEIFEHIHFGGARTELIAVHALDPWWNDRISSIRVDCRLGRGEGGS